MIQGLQSIIQPFLDVFQRVFPSAQNSGQGLTRSLFGGNGQLDTQQPIANAGLGFNGFLSDVFRPFTSIFTLLFGFSAAFKKGIKHLNSGADLDDEDFSTYSNKEDAALLKRSIRKVADSDEKAASYLNGLFRQNPTINNTSVWARIVDELLGGSNKEAADSVLKSRESIAKAVAFTQQFGNAQGTYHTILENLAAMPFEQMTPQYQRANAEVRNRMMHAIFQAEVAMKGGADRIQTDTGLNAQIRALWNAHVAEHGPAIQEVQVQQRLQLQSKLLAERLQHAEQEIKRLTDLRGPIMPPAAPGAAAGRPELTPAQQAIEGEIQDIVMGREAAAAGARPAVPSLRAMRDEYNAAAQALRAQDELVAARARRGLAPV